MRRLVPFSPALVRSLLEPRRRVWLVSSGACALLVTAFACIPLATPPAVTPTGVVDVGGARGEQGPNAPFALAFASPRGAASEVSTVDLVFTRPLTKLESIEDAAAPPIRIEPSVPGEFRWVGTHGVSFHPANGRLPLGTKFTVTVPATLRALDGSTLAKAEQFEFSTPPPALVSVSSDEPRERLSPTATFGLELSSEVDEAALKKVLELSVRGKPLAYTLKRPDAHNGKRLQLVPSAPLPLASPILVRAAAGLVGREGPLPSTKEARFSFESYGPLTVSGVSCSERSTASCEPGSSLWVRFSNPVRAKQALAAISVTGGAVNRANGYDDDDMVTGVSVSGRFEPGKKYLLEVRAGITDSFGQRLAAPFRYPFDVADYQPDAEIGANGDTLEPSRLAAIPIGLVNQADAKLFHGVLSVPELRSWRELDNDLERLALLSKRGQGQALAGGKRNTLVQHPLDAKAALGAAGHGPLAIAVRFTGSEGPRAVTKLLQVTDLGVSAKIGKKSAVLWVTQLSTGKPVSGATVQVYDVEATAPTQATTDDHGLATLQSPRGFGKRPLFEVKNGSDVSYGWLDDSLSPWRFDVRFAEDEELARSLAFTDRGLYRPGEELFLKAIVRDASDAGLTPVARAPVTVELVDPSGQVREKRELATNDRGTLAARFQLPRSAPIGGWTVRGTRGVSADFQVAEFRRAEFSVGVDASQTSYLHGEKSRWNVRGDFLFGAPMAGATVRWSLTRQRSDFTPKGTEDFETSANAFGLEDDASYGSSMLGSGDEQLDAKGAFTVDHELKLPGQRGAELVRLEAEVTDATRQSLSGSSARVVHPAAFYVGIKSPTGWFVDVPGKLAPRLIAVTPDGRRLDGKQIGVDLIRRRWTNVRKKVAGGRYTTESREVDEPVGHCDVRSVATADGASCELEVKSAGYHLLRARAKDEAGRTAEAALGLYALANSGASGFADTDGDKLELKLDRATYKVGDVARILVKAPFQGGEALLTVERGGVLEKRTVKLVGPTPTVTVPITEAMRPNAFVALHLLRGRSAPPKAGKPDLGAPTYRVGYAELKLETTSRKLAVELTPNQKDYRPGAQLELAVKVKDSVGAGAAAELTVWAVDDGVLTLNGYQTPDPHGVFSEPFPLGVRTLENRESLARLGLVSLPELLGLDKGKNGGDGGPAGAAAGSTAPRRDFRPAAFFDGNLLTDAAGVAKVRFKLPESLTSYRLMAVAVAGADRFGSAQATVTTSQRLMARPALPRFLRAGDRFSASVIITSKDYAGPLTVTGAFGNLVLDGAPKQELSIGKGESKEVRFAVATRDVGQATVRFSVDGQGVADSVELKREVSAPLVMETVASSGRTDSASAEQIGALKAARHDVGSVSVSVATTALVGLRGGVEQLLDYPYGCSEQLASRLVPLVPLQAIAKDFALPLPKDVPAAIRDTVDKLVRRQQSDGGFGLWADSPGSLPWVSAWVLASLAESKAHGYAVPASTFDAGAAYLRKQLEGKPEDGYDFANRAFAVDVLSTLGKPDPGALTRLFEARKDAPLFAKALLLHAYGTRDPKASATLLTEVESAVRPDGAVARVNENLGDGYAVLFDSSVRTAALVLRGLLAAKPNHPLAAPLARGLLADRRDGRWATTQESAWALLALRDYRLAQEGAVPELTARVWLAQKELFSRQFSGRGLNVAEQEVPLAAALNKTLTFEKTGTGPLFFETRIRYARRELPTQPLDHGFFVQKTLRRATPASLEALLGSFPARGELKFAPSDLVIADLVVVTPRPRHFVALDDPLPAGFEAVDSTLRTTASWATAAEQSLVDAERDTIGTGRGLLPSWHRREMHDDRVLFFVDAMPAGMYHYRYLARATTLGRFIMPPTRAEEMYAPEHLGRSAAATVSVE